MTVVLAIVGGREKELFGVVTSFWLYRLRWLDLLLPFWLIFLSTPASLKALWFQFNLSMIGQENLTLSLALVTSKLHCSGNILSKYLQRSTLGA